MGTTGDDGKRKQQAANDAGQAAKAAAAAPRRWDPALLETPERPDVPLSDVTHPDKADGEDHSVPPSDKGPEHDRLMRGLEPGETSAE